MQTINVLDHAEVSEAAQGRLPGIWSIGEVVDPFHPLGIGSLCRAQVPAG